MDEQRVNTVNQLFDTLVARLQLELKQQPIEKLIIVQDCILNIQNFKMAMTKDPAVIRREQEYLRAITKHLDQINNQQPPDGLFPERPAEP